MQHSDSQRIDTSTLVFLKNPMCVRVRVGVKDGLNGLGGIDVWVNLRENRPFTPAKYLNILQVRTESSLF